MFVYCTDNAKYNLFYVSELLSIVEYILKLITARNSCGGISSVKYSLLILIIFYTDLLILHINESIVNEFIAVRLRFLKTLEMLSNV
ncbi:hypothetical protein BdWA1_002318 [Babesia duncani]|uniref:Uncharacterized protein n=1 Tax=Babesia duncani TaxID=323732 RepID=A0AAD9PIY5_9APIC|nr:hypothetical protein BdWA1_002318 [Babesia duncani]